MQNLWFILPLISSLIIAAMCIVIQNNKQIPPVLIFGGKSILLAIIIMPFVPFITIPTNPIFYAAVLIIASTNAIAGTIVYSSNHKFGAGASSRIVPLSPVISLFLFFLIFPETGEKLINAGSTGVLFILAIFAMFASIFFMSKTQISGFKLVIFLLPACFLYSFSEIVSKLTIDQIDSLDSIVLYSGLVNLLQGIFCLVFAKLKNKRAKVVKATFKFKKRYLIPLIIIALCSLAGSLISLYSVKIMANPAVAALIAKSTPIWIYIYDIYKGNESLNKKVIPSFAFLIFATLTIILYNNFM